MPELILIFDNKKFISETIEFLQITLKMLTYLSTLCSNLGAFISRVWHPLVF